MIFLVELPGQHDVSVTSKTLCEIIMISCDERIHIIVRCLCTTQTNIKCLKDQKISNVK